MAKILRLAKTSWADLWSRRRADILALGAIALFFVACFPHGLFLGHYLLANDAFFYNYPLRTAAWEMIRSGELPLWTPYIFCGYPLLSMAQIGLGYPLTWGYAFLPAHVAEQIYVLAPFLLVPIFTYLYLREIERSALAALLGALTFGYGGMMASPLANNGLMPNSVMWMPLVLIGIERAYKSPLNALLLATFAYSMSVLTGYAQGFVYSGIVAGAYALFLVLTKARHRTTEQLSLYRWRPVLIASGAALFAVGIAAFQLLETARAVRRSIRHHLSFELFAEGPLGPWLWWKSFTTPIFPIVDMHAAVTPLAAVLAVVAVVRYARRNDQRDPRVFFWFVLAIIACILMFGSSTPVYKVIYQIPLLNRFRVPARHTFEWTFAAAVLSAYGWDIVATYLERKRQTGTYRKALTLYGSISLLVIATVVGVGWWLKSRTMKLDAASWPNAATYYQLFKIAFALLTAAALWRAALIKFNRPRFAICLTAVLILSFAEPSLLINRFWGSWGFRSWRFSQVTDATKFFHQFPAEQNRVYTRVFLMHEQFDNPPEFDSGNLNAIQHIHNLAGYEPLVLERFSRALGDVGLDGVATIHTGEPDDSLYTERSHVLDILNTTFTLSYVNFRPSFSSPQHRWTSEEPTMLGDMAPTTSRNLTVQSGADSILLITSLSNSVDLPQGSIVGKVRITTLDGNVIERDLRAGIDTAEWAHERPDVLVRIKHQLATPYDYIDLPGKDSFRAYRYRTELPLGAFKEIRLVEITNTSPSANLALLGVGLVDSKAKKTVFLSPPYSGLWKQVYGKENTIILRNDRAMPRAWLVTGAEAVDGEEALRRIRGESPKDFDPSQSVLLEVTQDELPSLSGRLLPADSGAKITSYKPNSLEIETNAPEPTVLVVSEMFYPGWVATVDGQPQRILLADFLLRGISLPAGKHTITMRYTAPAARYGAMISTATIIALIGLVVVAYRRQRRNHIDIAG